MSTFQTPDSSGQGSIIGGSGWGTHIHQSNDPLDPWYSIKIEKTGERIKGYGDFNSYVDSLLPESMRRNSNG